MTDLPLDEIGAKARAAPVGDALRAINAYLTILDPETVLALVARVKELEKFDPGPTQIGPRPRPNLFVCKGCPAYRTNDWREPSGDGETYDTGQYAWCDAAGQRSMGAYHYDHTPAPDWCPATGTAP